MLPRLLRVWLILLCVVFVGSTALYTLLGTPISVTGGKQTMGWFDAVVGGIITALGVSPLSFVIAAIQSGEEIGGRFDESRCATCGYDLMGLEAARCPECGTGLDRTSSAPTLSHGSESP